MKRPMLLSLLFLFTSFAIYTLVCASVVVEEEDGVAIIYTEPVKAVIFSHKAHTEVVGMRCVWCHDETFEMEALAMEAERDFNMDSLCNESYCGTCHNGDISFSTTTQCARCHIGQKGYDRLVKEGKIESEEKDEDNDTVIKKNDESFIKFDVVKSQREMNKKEALTKMIEAEYYPEEITLDDYKPENSSIFSHEKHLSREELSCMRCHPDIFIMKVGDKAVKEGHLTMAQMEKGKFCGTCHNGEDAFGITEKEYCKRCHPKR